MQYLLTKEEFNDLVPRSIIINYLISIFVKFILKDKL